MLHFLLSRYALVFFLFIFITGLIVFWCLPGPLKLQGSVDGIQNVEMEVIDKKIYVNVYLSRPQTCHDVVKNLGVSQFSIRGRIYIPECSQINSELIKIIYSISTVV